MHYGRGSGREYVILAIGNRVQIVVAFSFILFNLANGPQQSTFPELFRPLPVLIINFDWWDTVGVVEPIVSLQFSHKPVRGEKNKMAVDLL